MVMLLMPFYANGMAFMTEVIEWNGKRNGTIGSRIVYSEAIPPFCAEIPWQRCTDAAAFCAMDLRESVFCARMGVCVFAAGS